MKRKILSAILFCTVILTVLVPLSTLVLSLPANAASYSADPNWYDANKSILEINDIPDFIAFMNKMNELGTDDTGKAKGAEGNLAAISWTGKMPFEGQTIILNTDIVLNPGITFGTTAPSSTSVYKFSRTTKQVGFGGIFDGQGHTISGLYISASKGGSGSIFGVGGAATKDMNVVVRNLQIKNSLIENSAMGVASIFSSVAFDSHALIENVYSEANLLCTNKQVLSSDTYLKTAYTGVNIGGFCATLGGDLRIDSSIFAGTIATASSSAVKKYIGGMVGNIANKTLNDDKWRTAKLNIETSAYYGTYEGNGVYMGKLAGTQTAGSTVTVNNSIFGGTMKSTASFTPGSGAHAKASTYFVGRLIGHCSSNFTYNIAKTVATSTYRGGTAVGNFNELNPANTGSSVSVTVVIENNLTTPNLGDSISPNWVAQGTRSGHPVPASYITLFGKESLKHSYVTELPLTARDLFEQLGTKIANDGIYTEDSYRHYSDAYDEIVAMIFAKNADLSKINVHELKANVEAFLMTPADERRIELKNELGAKIVNSNNYYTEDSYSKYSAAHDAIIKSLDDATTVEQLNKIDVSKLKTDAEAILVKYAPEPETDASETGEPETDVPEADEPETDAPETDEPETGANVSESVPNLPVVDKGFGGCGSAAALSVVSVVAIIGAALITKRREI